MSCSNKVTYYIPRGYSHVEYKVNCGSTDPHGDRAVCDKCSSNWQTVADILARESVIEHDNAWLASAGWGEL
mgnify:FL=1